MERADDAIGMAIPAVAHASKTARHKFFIEVPRNEVVKKDASRWVCHI
jgi:hypothetical protein